MKKRITVTLAVLFGIANTLCAQTGKKAAPSNRDAFDWDEWQQGFFLDVGVLANYEDASPPDGLRIETMFLLLEIGGGYDFGRITFRLYGDFGFPLRGIVYWADGKGDVKDSLDVSNGKFGIEAAFKIVDTRSFDLLIPLGLVFNTTKYTQKDLSYFGNYTYGQIPCERKWIYKYTTVTAGLDFTIRLSDRLKLCILSAAAYPLDSNFTFEVELQDGYVFAATGSNKDRIEQYTDILTFSAGIGLRVNF